MNRQDAKFAKEDPGFSARRDPELKEFGPGWMEWIGFSNKRFGRSARSAVDAPSAVLVASAEWSSRKPFFPVFIPSIPVP